MTDEQDQSGPSDGEPARPRKRRHRRATRPATGGDPAADVPARAGRDDTDAGWAPDAPDSDGPRGAKPSKSPPESAQDRWWREQRPPHWQ